MGEKEEVENISRQKSQGPQRAFHVGAAASCVGLSRQTQPRQRAHFYLYPGCDANERGDTPP